MANDVLAQYDAFAALYTRLGSHVYQVALNALRNPAAAEDIAQQAFLRAWPHYKPGAMTAQHEQAWLSKIAMNLVRDRWRALQSRPLESSLDALFEEGFEPEDPHDHIDRAEDANDAAAAIPDGLNAMNPRQRKAVSLRFGRDMLLTEIGGELGLTKTGVSVLIKEGLTRARTAIDNDHTAA